LLVNFFEWTVVYTRRGMTDKVNAGAKIVKST